MLELVADPRRPVATWEQAAWRATAELLRAFRARAAGDGGAALAALGAPTQLAVWCFEHPDGLLHMCDLRRSACVVVFSLDDALDAIAEEEAEEGGGSGGWLDKLVAWLGAVRAHKQRRRAALRALSPLSPQCARGSRSAEGGARQHPNIVLVGELSAARRAATAEDELHELLDDIHEAILMRIDDVEVNFLNAPLFIFCESSGSQCDSLP